MRRRSVTLALFTFIAATAPPLAGLWKGSLPLHVLVQFPLLLTAGVLVGVELACGSPARKGMVEAEGLPVLLLGAFCMAFWMLPRWVDAAVIDWRIDAMKVASLVLLAGLPFGWGWQRAGSIARGFVAANAISMLLALGLLYLSYPDRLCNTYLLDEQSRLGRAMILIALCALLLAAIQLIAGRHREEAPPDGGAAPADSRGER